MNQPHSRRRKKTTSRPIPKVVPAQKNALDRLNPNDLDGFIKRAGARADLYEIFSIFFQEVPSPDLLAIFRHSDFLEIVRILLSPQRLARWKRFAAGKTPLDQFQRRLRLEYHNLFLLPTSQRFVPRESAFFHNPKEPQIAKRRSESMQKFYRRIGLTPMAKFKDQPDHISQIMHFMNVLCEREKDYLKKKNVAQLETTCQIEADFVEKHLKPWVPLLRDRMELATRFPFFRYISETLDEFVTDDVKWTGRQLDQYGLRRRSQSPAKPPAQPQAKPHARSLGKPQAQPQARSAAPTGEKKTEADKPPRRRRRGGRRRRPRKGGDSS